jgi:alkanesulfonate monooxygenase SsuD/methylene tetrahydromethanopterin reductase-like flavin-dependent oxidoreductase (luciferase family)/putative sterol carrier protein
LKFGLFYELQLPRPWTEHTEAQLFREALEQIALADRLGFHSVWEVEHHFLEEYSHSGAPEVFLAAASQRTERIRLGHGIVQLPPAFNHPARVAERIATLDLVSGGRVEFGTGQGSSQMELGGFGVDRELKHAQWEEMLAAVLAMMTEEPFPGFRGRFLSMPPRNVVPKPLQKPHPPLWVACSRRETILLAARKGLGALSFSFVEPEQAKTWADEYYRLLASDECVPAGLTVNPQVAVVLPFMCHADEQTAIDRGIDGAHFFGYSLAHYYVFGQHRPGVTSIWEEFQAHRRDYGFARELIRADDQPLGIKLLQHGLGSLRGAVGTPAQITALLERYERAGVDHVIFAAQAGPNRHADIAESIELFAKEVMPRFAECEPARERAKQERFAPAISRALARRAASPSSRQDYVVSPQSEPAPAPMSPAPMAARNGHAPGGSAILRWLVRDRSDQQLERIMPVLERLVFGGMPRAFRADRAYGFAGEVEYQISGRGRVDTWTLRIANGKAATTSGAAVKPRAVLRMGLPTFARVSAGMLTPMAAVLERKMEVEGDLGVVSRLGEMFGGAPNF